MLGTRSAAVAVRYVSGARPTSSTGTKTGFKLQASRLYRVAADVEHRLR